jgi:hypothetical protein
MRLHYSLLSRVNLLRGAPANSPVSVPYAFVPVDILPEPLEPSIPFRHDPTLVNRGDILE